MSFQTAFVLVVTARFLLPLLIFRFPLPALLACLVLDGVDQTIFQSLGYDPPGYQNYDKAMDLWYLAIAYVAMMRNWTDPAAFRVGRFLYYYRLVGVLLFEFADSRWFLLVFANTFEYFFIAYEAIRLRWDPARFGMRFWVLLAGAIWVVVKLPQEWWIHIAQLDLTDALADHPWLYAVIAALVAAAVGAFWVWGRPFLGPPQWAWRIAPQPVPDEIDDAGKVAAWQAAHSRVLSAITLEKVLLVGALSVIYGQLLPNLRSTPLELFTGISVFVVVNAALILWTARAARTLTSLYAAFAARVLVNLALVVLAEWALGPEEDLNQAAVAFFVVMVSLLTLLVDSYLPVHRVRVQRAVPNCHTGEP